MPISVWVRTRAPPRSRRGVLSTDRRYMTRALGQSCLINMDDIFTWPDCQSHYDVTLTNGDFYSWLWDSMGEPHGSIHLWLGSAMDCDSMYVEIGTLVGEEIANSLAYFAVEHRRSLFAESYWSCEGETVTVDKKPEEVGGWVERR